MIKKLLIANRGEIAIRVARTASAMGIKTVGVQTQDDAQSLHVKYMDQVVTLPHSGVAGYLDYHAIVDLAAEHECDAIHPGYGLLSERIELAQACHDKGIVFVGPTAQTLALLGDKVSARTVAEQQGVPVIRGSAPLKDVDAARAAFDDLGGHPLMLKAVNGGGGRGMRVVEAADQIGTALEQCRAEALSAFGDDTIYAERFLPSVRHIEVQIVGDGTSVTHLWERDCSVQRRNQKVIELAPAPDLDEETCVALLEAAVSIGRASNYRGLGTVEFLVETDAKGGGGFYFIETNPRIQVEHTITEEITGWDLVELQLQIAAGQTLEEIGLPLNNPRRPMGCSVQLRVNTEIFDTDGNLMPTGGTLSGYAVPSGPGVRVDGCGYPGYRTNPNFDSLLAKLIIHDAKGDLKRLFQKAQNALSEFQVEGVQTNIPFLTRLLDLTEVQEWSVNVRSVDANMAKLAISAGETPKTRYFDITPSEDAVAVDQQHLPEGVEGIGAPMQAMVDSLLVAPGEVFAKGQDIAIIEAMKMQHVIAAPTSGRVEEILTTEGAVIDKDALLISYTPDSDGAEVDAAQELPDPDHIRADLAALNARLAYTLDENRPKAVDRRRSRNQRTTRENLADLCAGGDFHEYGQLLLAGQRQKLGLEKLLELSPADGIVTGIGDVNAEQFDNRRTQVAIMAYDSTVMAGTQGFFGHQKTDRMLHVAQEKGLASIFLTEGGGGRPNDDDFAYTMHSGLNCATFAEFSRLRGWGPRITVNSGYCFAGNAALFGAGDIRIATRNSWIGLAGPAMIEAGGLGAFHPTDIGPAPMHAETGLLDILAEDDEQAMQLSRQVLSYFQGDVTDWAAADQRMLRHAIPENRKRSYQIRPLIDTLADEGSFLELGAQHAPGMITGFLRIEGRPMGVIANNPQHLGGALDATASSKAARFIRLCSRFDLPVLSLCDTPGFMVGPESETEGAVGAAADFIGAGACMKTALFLVCLRKGYGIGAQAMAGGSFNEPTLNISWPTGEFGAMGLEGGVRLGYRKEIEAEPTPEAQTALYEKLVARSYENGKALNVASFGEIDAVIDPSDTRNWIAQGMRRSDAK